MTVRHQQIEAWMTGWAHSRGTALPQARPYGFELQVGLPGHWIRHGLPHLDAEQVLALARRIGERGVLLKICAPAQAVAAALPADWAVTITNTLMSATLADVAEPAALAEGFAATAVSRAGQVLSVEIQYAGARAAGGRVGLHGDVAVFDQIETDAGFQRRGLGRRVMRLLSDAARASGATRGLLVATDEGQALYATLGWQVECALTTAERVADHMGDPEEHR